TPFTWEPPSTNWVVPLTWAASSDARKAATPPMSASGSPSLPRGIWRRSASNIGVLFVIDVGGRAADGGADHVAGDAVRTPLDSRGAAERPDGLFPDIVLHSEHVGVD